jgi:hypothetical protein
MEFSIALRVIRKVEQHRVDHVRLPIREEADRCAIVLDARRRVLWSVSRELRH